MSLYIERSTKAMIGTYELHWRQGGSFMVEDVQCGEPMQMAYGVAPNEAKAEERARFLLGVFQAWDEEDAA